LSLNNKRLSEGLHEAVANLKDFLKMLRHSSLPNVAVLLALGFALAGLAISLVQGEKSFTGFWVGVWWAVVTMTTTGYGDFYPITPLGRAIGVIAMLSGIVLVSFFTATISSLFVAAKIREGKGLEQVHYHDHVVICGYGVLTRRLLDSLLEFDKEKSVKATLIADIPGEVAEELISEYQRLELKFVRGDWTHESILKRAGVLSAKTVVVMPDELVQTASLRDEKTILTTLAVKALNPKTRLLAHISQPDNRVFLQRAQADEIFVADEFTGYLLASRTLSSGLPQAAREMFTVDSPTRLTVTDLPADLNGKTFAHAADFFLGKGAILIGLTREETPLEASDILSADSGALDEFIRRKFQEAGLGAGEKTLTRARINPPRDTIIDQKDKGFVIGKVS